MKKITTTFIPGLLLIGISLMPAQAQETYKVQSTSTFSIVGSSNIRDWEAQAGNLSGTLTLNEEFLKKDVPKTGTTIDAVSLKIPVASIDGGRGEIMNGKIRTALQAEAHPDVTYQLISATVTGVSDKSQGIFDASTTGKLTIGGVTREITMNIKGQKKPDGSYLFFGSKPMKMSQFEIEAPSALFGQLQTEDDIAVRFSLEVKK
jgi:polyisoprenoid-binding protein YceI